MNILVICSGHGIDDDRVSRKQAVSLANLGHTVTVCGQKRLAYVEPKLNLIDVDSLEKLSSIQSQTKQEASRFKRISRLSNLYKLIKKQKPDLIVAHEFETGTLARFIKRRLGIPYVFDAHECYEDTMHLIFPKIMQGIARRFFVGWLKKIIVRAKAVTVATPASLSYTHAKDMGIPVAVLHNAPIVEYFPYSDIEGETPIIVHEGNLSFERGALEILDALALVSKERKFKFLVLGTIPEEVLRPFKAKMEALGLSDVVEMRGRLQWTEFGKIQATGQIGLICSQPIPNHMKGLSNKLYNYMACGLAVLGMQGSESEKIIKQYDCGITVDTTRPAEIAKGIIWLIDHPAERRQMALNGRKAIDKELGWHCMEKVMKDIYVIHS